MQQEMDILWLRDQLPERLRALQYAITTGGPYDGNDGKGGKGGKGKGGGAGGDRDNDADQGGNSDNDGNGTEVTQAASGQDADVDTGLSETEKKGKKGKTPATDGQKEADPAAGAETGLRTEKAAAVGKAKSKSTGSRHSARVPQK
jgi:hypothetical protein